MERIIKNIQEITSRFGCRTEEKNRLLHIYAESCFYHDMLEALQLEMPLEYCSIFAFDEKDFFELCLVLRDSATSALIAVKTGIKKSESEFEGVVDLFPESEYDHKYMAELFGLNCSGCGKEPASILSPKYMGRQHPQRRYD